MASGYHTPVLLQDCLDGMQIKSGGIYVDVTFGGGGHSRALLERMGAGRLIAFDKDPDAKANVIDDERFMLISQDFRFVRNHLRAIGVEQVDGLLADLGVSSHQLDQAERGFSIRNDGPMDMRMDERSPKSAAQLIKEMDESELADIFFQYGDLRNARRIAREVVARRDERPIKTTEELKECVGPLAQRGKENQFLARVFQSLRIAVNDELGALKTLLEQSVKILKPGGRLVVISYHSLEDRLVKNFMRAGNWDGHIEKDIYGHADVPFNPLTRKPIIPSEEEIQKNERARSAKLRIAEKCS